MESRSLPVNAPAKIPDSGKTRRGTSRHARSSTKVLKDWFAAHNAYPYPSDQEKEELRSVSGLSIRQISYWFVNARRRGGVKKSAVPTESSVPELLPSTEPATSQNSGWDAMNPLDRWRNSPPEEEPVSLDAIAQAIGASQSLPGLSSSIDWSEPASWSQGQTALSTDSISSLGSSDQSNSSNSSAHSYASDSLFNIRTQDGRRRRRRKNQKYRNPLAASPADGAKRIYQCTFCTDTFKSRYDWTRHEGTLHLVLEKWTCLPSGPRYSDPAEAVARCVLCDEADPSEQHLQRHKYRECAAKPLAARSFYRKDHLRQHLRLAHGVDDVLPSMDGWKAKITRVKSRCGFCGETFALWADRNDHLVEHYRAGALIKDWKGCRGLEPAVALLVQNAMPPYLIGAEANNMEPFSASRVASKSPAADGERDAVPSQFESLTARLGDYIKAAMEDNRPVTDDSIRREARVIVYGDDDPWNQTPADNGEWLRLFKAGYGLANDSQVPGSSELDPSYEWPVESSLDKFSDLNTAVITPFTFENMQTAAVSSSASIPLDFCGAPLQDVAGDGLAVPWSWQTPECLAEFRQMGCMPSMEIPTATEVCNINDPFFGAPVCPELLAPEDQFRNTA
ncbi:hypothetical protein K4K59_010807 [Colletotrichum sp. SAR11_240]|nr:hypothetical protein K4K59_010807 [Colletotrichum sp. SAR11_240]